MVRKGDRVVCLSRLPKSGIILTSTGTVVSAKGGTTSVVNADGSIFTGGQSRVCYMVTSSPTKSRGRGTRRLGGPAHRGHGAVVPIARRALHRASHQPHRHPGTAVAASLYRAMIDNVQNAARSDLPVTLGIDRIDYLTPEVTGTKLARSFGLGGRQGILLEGPRPAAQPPRPGFAMLDSS